MLTENIGEILKLIFVAAILDACFGVCFFKDKQPIKRYLVPLFNVKYRIYSNIVLFQV